MPRPQIPDVVKDRVEDLHERHRGYQANSFQEALSTVADIAERSIQETELKEKLPFQYEVEDFRSGIKIHLTPESDSNIKITDGNLETPRALIEMSDLYEELKQIDGVRTASGGHEPSETFQVILREEDRTDRSFDKIIDDIFTVLATAIQRKEDTIEQIEQRAGQYASPNESTEE